MFHYDINSSYTFEEIKALTKTLEETELKAKVSIRFLQDKELFSFKLADLIISKKRINLSIPIKPRAFIMHSIFKPIFAHEK